MTRHKPKSHTSGRPRKFPGPSRVVTVTLPVSTLANLAQIDADRARAIVHAVAAASNRPPSASVEIVKVTPDVGVILVPYSEALNGVEGLKLIQIMPTRYLLIIEPEMPLSALEVSLQDRIETLPADRVDDRQLLTCLIQELRDFRRSKRTKTGGLILVDFS